MSSDRDDRIRMRAHDLWIREDRPDGRDAEHWRRAEEQIDREDADSAAGASPDPQAPSEGVPTPAPGAPGAGLGGDLGGDLGEEPDLPDRTARRAP